jgi:hypothetical protein
LTRGEKAALLLAVGMFALSVLCAVVGDTGQAICYAILTLAIVECLKE